MTQHLIQLVLCPDALGERCTPQYNYRQKMLCVEMEDIVRGVNT